MKNIGESITRWMASGKPGWAKAVVKAEKLQIPRKDKYAEFFEELRAQILFGAEFERMINDDAGLKNYSLEYLKEHNRACYATLLPSEAGSKTGYDHSIYNPDYSVKRFGKKMGHLVSVIAGMMHTFRFEICTGNYRAAKENAEFFFTLYRFWQQDNTDYKVWLQAYKDVIEKDMEKKSEASFYMSTAPDFSLYRDLLQSFDFADPRYLYRYGLYVDEPSIRLAQYLAAYPPKELLKLAKYHVQAFKDAFKRKNYSYQDKKYVQVAFPLGMERLAKLVTEEVEKLGLIANVGRPQSRGVNDQYYYDSSYNSALYYNQSYADRAAIVVGKLFKIMRHYLRLQCGGLVIMTFGETPFVPVQKATMLKFTPKQIEISRKQQAYIGMLYYESFPQKDTAFSAISFPHPEIGKDFEAIFKDTLELNYLDSKHYAKMQEGIITLLDQAEHVLIKGVKGNDTDIRIMLRPLKNPKKETNFENCVADMNIPVGEVFTSPQLQGTNGVLHVHDIYLNDLRFYNLKFTFKDGMVTDYSCTNYPSETENKKYVFENIFEPHQTLPMGEFAIGTNTKAYLMASKYKIEYLLPVLIIEKMGPHFAIGDTCFSNEEDEVHYGLISGKEMVAKENEFSAKRKTNPEEAYTYKHTDITLPYDMLAEITAVTSDGTKLPIIKNGRFVVPGTEELNQAIEEAEKLRKQKPGAPASVG